MTAAFLACERRADAAGTFFVLELTSGLTESAYLNGDPGFSYGVALGGSFKLRRLPVRWYLLGTLMSRQAQASAEHHGLLVTADRSDLDLYLAERSILPIAGPFRVYLEAGIGRRTVSETLRRAEELGTLSQETGELLVVLAAGLQARFSNRLSVGLRGEVTPLSRSPDLSAFVAGLAPVDRRIALLAQVGLHF